MKRALLLVTLAACGSVGTGDKAGTPTIATIAPDHGPAGGGVQVTITGTGFQGDGGQPLVLVGGHLATTVTATSDTELTFSLPAADQDGTTADVEVVSQTGVATAADAFRYHAHPVVLAVSPDRGRSAGGTAITVTGRGFMVDDAGVPTLELGGATATNVQIVSDTQLTATTGASAPGTRAFRADDVVLTNANGSGTLSAGFSVTAPGMLAIERTQGGSRIFHVDLTTKRVSTVAVATRKLIGCAVSPGGVIYSTTGMGGGQIHALVTVDPVDGQVTVVGPLLAADNVPRSISAIAFVGAELYGTDTGCCSASNRVVKIDTASGALTFAGAGPGPLGRGNAIAARDGTSLYYADNTGGQLSSVSTIDSSVTGGPQLTGSFQPDTAQGMTLINDVLYIGERSTPSTVLSVDRTTGAMTPFVAMPATTNGLCPTPVSF